MPIFMAQRTSLRLVVALLTITALLVVPAIASRWGRNGDQQALLMSPRGAFDRLPRRGGATIAALQQRITDDPNTFAPYLSLALAYLQEVRETGDSSLYARTEALLDRAARLEPRNPELFATRGMLALARHDFVDALALGEQAVRLNPNVARYYGVVADAQIELGMYDEALETLQVMVDRRPDFNSFSRIAYARELYGDIAGARDAMRRALEAGGGVPEHAAWSYTQLGNLAFGSGDLATAKEQYARAQQTVESYPAALAGQAHVAAATGDLKQAAILFQQAFNRSPLAEYAIALGDVFTKMGDRQQAQRQYELVRAIDKLLTSNGVNTDLETALFFADHDIELPASVARARAAYAARPSIHTADGLAWTLYKTGDLEEAQRLSTEALRLGTRDALKLFHAGMIAKALGQADQARTYLQAAVDLNPHFSLLYSDLAATTLQELEAQTPPEGRK